MQIRTKQIRTKQGPTVFEKSQKKRSEIISQKKLVRKKQSEILVRSRAQTTFSRCSQIFRWYNSIWSNFLGHGCTLLRPEEISSNCGVQVVQKSSGILTKKKTCWPSPCAERAGVSNLALTTYMACKLPHQVYYLSRRRYRACHNKIRGQSLFHFW